MSRNRRWPDRAVQTPEAGQTAKRERHPVCLSVFGTAGSMGMSVAIRDCPQRGKRGARECREETEWPVVQAFKPVEHGHPAGANRLAAKRHKRREDGIPLLNEPRLPSGREQGRTMKKRVSTPSEPRPPTAHERGGMVREWRSTLDGHASHPYRRPRPTRWDARSQSVAYPNLLAHRRPLSREIGKADATARGGATEAVPRFPRPGSGRWRWESDRRCHSFARRRGSRGGARRRTIGHPGPA